MKKYLLISIVLFSFLNCQQAAPEKIHLQYRADGTFKIAQFTDLHYVNGSPNSAITTATIKYVLETEKPDVAVLTGDQAIDKPSKEVWRQIVEIFEDAKVPFALVFGNHDAETITRDSVFDVLTRSPYFIGERGSENIHGVGNYAIPVYASASASGKPELILYCFDSNDYDRENTIYNYYDRIHYDQIAWYRGQSENFTKANNGQPVPSLMFFHIPLPEVFDIIGQPKTTGTAGEEPTPSKINSGMLASILDMKDVFGIFTGHDHDNDYIGMEFGIALAYGRVTGTDAYGKMERGGRIIELDKNKPRRFTTWIRTPKGGEEHRYYYPSGITKEEEDNAVYLPAQNVNPVTQGVNYTYYEGNFESTDELTSAKPIKQGVLKNFSIDEADSLDHFGFEFRTWIKIPEKTIYYFYTCSDDGSKLFIDGELIVDNDGSHATQYADSKAVALEAGYHELRLRYFEDYGGQTLEVGFLSKNMCKTKIPDDLLFVPE